MNEFHSTLSVKNKNNFKVIYYNRILCYLRENIYEHILIQEEKDYFDIDCFRKKYTVNSDILNKLVNTVVEELGKLGWKTKIGFGGTGLFIYSTENPPITYWG